MVIGGPSVEALSESLAVQNTKLDTKNWFFVRGQSWNNWNILDKVLVSNYHYYEQIFSPGVAPSKTKITFWSSWRLAASEIFYQNYENFYIFRQNFRQIRVSKFQGIITEKLKVAMDRRSIGSSEQPWSWMDSRGRL